MKIKVDISDKKNIWFTSDFHLFHKKVMDHDNRPFRDEQGEPDVDAMHETIIANWNKVVGKNDIVFYLGDLCLVNPKRTIPIVSRLNGTIHYIMGNHDEYEDIVKIGRFATVYDYVDLNIKGIKNLNKTLKDKKGKIQEHANIHFCLMHFPIYSWNKRHHAAVMVHGHSHGNLHHNEDNTYNYYANNNKAIDVGCNIHDYTPVSYTEIIDMFNLNPSINE